MDEKNNEELIETVEAIENAQEKLEQLSKDAHERELAELRDKYIRDQYSVEKFGYEHGKTDGLAEGKAARSCRRQGSSVLQRARQLGLAEGKAVGSKERNIEIAKNMLKEGFDIKIIAKITNLTEKEISDIK